MKYYGFASILSNKGVAYKLRECGSVHNEESIGHEDHSYFSFDVENVSVQIHTTCSDVNAVTGECEDEK